MELALSAVCMHCVWHMNTWSNNEISSPGGLHVANNTRKPFYVWWRNAHPRRQIHSGFEEMWHLPSMWGVAKQQQTRPAARYWPIKPSQLTNSSKRGAVVLNSQYTGLDIHWLIMLWSSLRFRVVCSWQKFLFTQPIQILHTTPNFTRYSIYTIMISQLTITPF